MLKEGFLDNTKQTKESDLIDPTLIIFAKLKLDGKNNVSTLELKNLLLKTISLSEKDLEKLPSGGLRIKRIIQNLISHKSILDPGFISKNPDGTYSITSKGEEAVLMHFVKSVPVSGFDKRSKLTRTFKIVENKEPFTEQEFVLPALLVLAKAYQNFKIFQKSKNFQLSNKNQTTQHQHQSEYLETKEIIAGIKSVLPVSSKDASVLNSGGFRFDRLVHNLVSHKSINNYIDIQKTVSGKNAQYNYRINQAGLTFLASNMIPVVFEELFPSKVFNKNESAEQTAKTEKIEAKIVDIKTVERNKPVKKLSV